ncbi:hypothetical protein AB4Z54_30125 [Streptomyces sp. MCAF7]
MTYETSERSTVPAADGPAAPARQRLHWNKVPEVTVYFWIIKVLCTTVGETAADLLNDKAGLGLTGVSVLMSALLAVVLVVQFRTSAYRAAVYWFAVALISVVGTLISDNLTDNVGVPLQTSTTVFAILLAVVFAVWYRRERTLSIHHIDTTSRESFYWLAVLFTFALGTAAGDLVSERMDLGSVPRSGMSAAAGGRLISTGRSSRVRGRALCRSTGQEKLSWRNRRSSPNSTWRARRVRRARPSRS